jgi:alpha/beta superfamily hydrolase
MGLRIAGPSVELEAVLRVPDTEPLRAGAVLCHPHPVYGGTMDNRVVFRSGKAAMAAGLAALRFNFRGVGSSTGVFDNGAGETEDVRAATDYLAHKYPGLPLALIGFSFGAWVGLQVACQDPRIHAIVGLGLPLNSYDFEFLVDNSKPSLFVSGSNDKFCPREKMEGLAGRLPPSSTVRWIEGADHFFTNELEELQLIITDFLRRVDFQRASA